MTFNRPQSVGQGQRKRFTIKTYKVAQKQTSQCCVCMFALFSVSTELGM